MANEEKNVLDWITMILVIIGGLNWGLVGAFNIDLVELTLGSLPALQNTVYILVGISALYMIYFALKK